MCASGYFHDAVVSMIRTLSLCCTACMSLGVSQLDSVIIAPPSLPEGETLTLAHLQPLWAQLEKIVQSQKAASIGTSDLDKTQLEELYNWAQVGKRTLRGIQYIKYLQFCHRPPNSCMLSFLREELKEEQYIGRMVRGPQTLVHIVYVHTRT